MGNDDLKDRREVKTRRAFRALREDSAPADAAEVSGPLGEAHAAALGEISDAESPEEGLELKRFEDLQFAVVDPKFNRLGAYNLGERPAGGVYPTVQASGVGSALSALSSLTTDRGSEIRGTDRVDIILFNPHTPLYHDQPNSDPRDDGLSFLMALEGLATSCPDQFRDTKIVICTEPGDDWTKPERDTPRVIADIEYPDPKTIGHAGVLPFMARLRGSLGDARVVKKDAETLDAQRKLHADNFNKEARALLEKYGINRTDNRLWKNESCLRELHDLINRYRAQENLPPVEFIDRGPLPFVLITCELSSKAFVEPETLFQVEESEPEMS
ncbi:MAG: hypothetical protein WC285_03590 [Candidatus Gracilibacteria bacterium]|jgi:hypothetical protein